MAVVGVLVEAEVGHQDELVTDRVAHGAQRDLHDAVADPRRRCPGRPCAPARRTGSGPGTPSDTSRLASTTSESSECCTWPGMESIGTGSAVPSRTKSGATRSSGPRRASATSRRNAGVRRSRRSRRTGKPPGSGRRRRFDHPPSLRGVVAAGAQGADQLVDDALGRRIPGLVHAGEPGRPGRRRRRRRRCTRRGTAAAPARPPRCAAPGTPAPPKVAVNVRASAAATRSSSAGSGARRATVRYASTRRTSQPFAASPAPMVVGREVGGGEQHTALAARHRVAGTPRPGRARCAAAGHQVRLDAGAAQRVGRGRPDGGHQHRAEGAGVAQRAHEAVHRVDRGQHHPGVVPARPPRRPAAQRRRPPGRPGGSAAPRAPWRRPARARPPGPGPARRRGSRPRCARPAAPPAAARRPVQAERGHRSHHDDGRCGPGRRRPDRPTSCAPRARTAVVPCAITATGVSGARPPCTSAAAMAARVAMPMRMTRVPPTRASASQSCAPVPVRLAHPAGHDGDRRGQAALGDRDAERGGHAEGGRDAGHHLPGDAGRAPAPRPPRRRGRRGTGRHP